MLVKSHYEFASEQEASQVIKSAATLYGAIKCGITRRDRRFDYDPLYDIGQERELSWERDFPFEPKTVIVIMTEMDYLAMSTAPTWITDATVGNAYVEALKVAAQTALFLRQLGYKAVATMNDMGINAPYAVAAGLGEGGRNGQVITTGYGPRVRISKVYTDLDYVEYDKPRTLGVANFCLHCKLHGSLPIQAIRIISGMPQKVSSSSTTMPKNALNSGSRTMVPAPIALPHALIISPIFHTTSL
jgi:hypothetical protein